MTLRGTKFEVGKKYRCSTGLEAECMYAYEFDSYYCMFGKITKAVPYAGYGMQVGNHSTFSGENWEEILPPVSRRFYVAKEGNGLNLYYDSIVKKYPSFKGELKITFADGKLTAEVLTTDLP